MIIYYHSDLILKLIIMNENIAPKIKSNLDTKSKDYQKNKAMN